LLKRGRITIFVARSLAGEMDRDQPKNVLSQARSCNNNYLLHDSGYHNDTNPNDPRMRPKPKPGQKCGDINFPNADEHASKVRGNDPLFWPQDPSLDDPPRSDRTIWLGIIEAVTKLDITAAAEGSEVRECKPRSLPRGMEAL